MSFRTTQDSASLNRQIQNLQSDLANKTEILEATQKELKKYQAITSGLQRMETQNKAAIAALTAENELMTTELEKSLTYTLKLEHRASMSKMADYASDLNFHLQERLNTLRA